LGFASKGGAELRAARLAEPAALLTETTEALETGVARIAAAAKLAGAAASGAGGPT
jgi:hypothetical protein